MTHRTATCQKNKRPFLVMHLMISLLWLQPFAASAQDLDSSALPVVWLRADQGAFTATSWTDYSGHQRNATALKSEAPEKNSWFNFNPAVSFKGSNYMKIPYNLEGLSEITIIAVFQSADSMETGIWGAEDAVSRQVMLTTRRAAGPDSAVDGIGRNESFAVISTVLQNWEKATTVNDAAYLALGSAGRKGDFKFFNGMLAELLVFDHRLDFATQLKFETYLGIKYGIPVTRGNYLTTDEAVLWKKEQNNAFRHRITGLGKNDFFLLNQKQARSAFDQRSFLTMGVETIAKTNAENTARINDGDYLIWGDNNGAMNTASDGLLDVLNRKWLMTVSGATASGMQTKLQVDLKQLPQHELGYWLVIDRSGNDRFDADALTYIMPSQISPDSIATFDQVVWDLDRSGKDMFGFVKAQDLLATVAVDSPSCRDLTSGRASIRIISGKGPFQFQLRNSTTGNLTESQRGAAKNNLVFDRLPMGEYELRLTDANGAESVRQFAVTVPNALKINLGPDRNLVPGQEIILAPTEGVTGAVSYRWKSSYGWESSGGTLKVPESGIYKVEVTNAAGCVFSDEVVVNGTTRQRYEVYPSVTSDGKFNISVSLPAKGNIAVTVYDIKGARQLELQGREQAEYLFRSEVLTPGTYMVVLKTERGTQTKKLIVQ